MSMPQCKHDWRDREAAGMGALGTICELCAVQRIAELEAALKQIAVGADEGDVGDGLTFSEIAAIARSVL